MKKRVYRERYYGSEYNIESNDNKPKNQEKKKENNRKKKSDK